MSSSLSLALTLVLVSSFFDYSLGNRLVDFCFRFSVGYGVGIVEVDPELRDCLAFLRLHEPD